MLKITFVSLCRGPLHFHISQPHFLTLLTFPFPEMGCVGSKKGEDWVFSPLSEETRAPIYATTGAVGADLYAPKDVTLKAMETTLVPTGMATRAPPGFFCKIAGRSGMAANHGLYVFNGVIDPDYEGELYIIIYNSTSSHYVVKEGERIAQIICERYDRPPIVLGQIPPVETNRTGGVGSTGR